MLSSTIKTAIRVNTVQRTLIRTAALNSSSVNFAEDSVAAKPWKDIPGPSSLPIIGPMLHFLPPKGELSNQDTMGEVIYNKYGPIVRMEGFLSTPPLLMLFDPDSIAHVLRSENTMPVRPGFSSLDYYRKKYSKSKNQTKYTGLLTDHFEMWKEFRSTVNPIMLQPKTIKLYSKVLDEVALDMIKRMKSLRNSENKIEKELDIEMNLWALESIGIVALGGRLNCFDPNLAADSPERKLIQCVHDIFETSNELDWKPNLWKYYPTKAYKRAMKLYEDQENLAKFFVKRAMEDLKKKNNSSDEKGVLEKLLEINEEVAVIMACDMLLAGVDTAANTVLAVLYHLATNPDKQDKLREELTSDKEISPYLKACIKESIRIRPVVSGNIRQATKDYVLMGYHVPKGKYITFHHENLSVMESQYPKPLEFIPERWIDKDCPVYHGSAHPFSYSPFGFGVRSCLGRRIAELEMQTFVSRLIQIFRVEWSGPPPKTERKSLVYLKGPFNFTFNDV